MKQKEVLLVCSSSSNELNSIRSCREILEDVDLQMLLFQMPQAFFWVFGLLEEFFEKRTITLKSWTKVLEDVDLEILLFQMPQAKSKFYRYFCMFGFLEEFFEKRFKRLFLPYFCFCFSTVGVIASSTLSNHFVLVSMIEFLKEAV